MDIAWRDRATLHHGLEVVLGRDERVPILREAEVAARIDENALEPNSEERIVESREIGAT